MCIIAFKPKGVVLPDKQTLHNCFARNPDGAGYMFAEDNKVNIKKGYMSFEAFYQDLILDYNRLGKDNEFVMHFRIGTQGGNIPANTHPFPISDNVEDLKELKIKCDVGLAHNGILSLTSNYSLNSTTSDTMDFITDYLSCIIRDGAWYKHKTFDKTKLLIERLIGTANKFTIMSNDGHTEMIGYFIEDNGVFYSNSSYESYKTSYVSDINIDFKEYDEDYDEDSLEAYAHKFYSKEDGWYHFDECNCPFALYGVDDYCFMCTHFAKCMYNYDVDERRCIYGHCSDCEHCRDCPNSMLNAPIEGQTEIK